MELKSPFNSLPLWLSLVIVILGVALGILAYYGELTFIYLNLISIEVHHLFSWTGAGFIALFIPFFHYLKRRQPKSYKTLIQIHVFGNLAAFVLISIHFGHHFREFAEIIPHPSTGAPLYTGIILLVFTGIILRYRLAKKYFKPLRSLHVGLMMAFYLIIVFHILVGMEVI